MPLRLLVALIGILSPLPAHAALITPAPCPVGGLLPCAGGGVTGLQTFLSGYVLGEVRTGVIALLLVMFTTYAARLLLQSDEENTVEEVKNAYSQAVYGTVIISIATFVVASFGQGTGTNLVEPTPVNSAITNVTNYFKVIVGVLLSVLVTTQGIRLIVLQGEESEIEQQRKKFFHSLLGVAVILLTNVLIAAVQPGQNSSLLSEEVRGVINFGLTLFGVLAVVSFMVAGFLLIVSVDESLKDRAKKIMFGTVIALVIVFSAWTIVNYFVSL